MIIFYAELQNGSGFRDEALGRKISYGLSDHSRVSAQRGIMTDKKIYNEKNYYDCWEDINSIHERITDVRFMSEMDCMLYDAWDKISALFLKVEKIRSASTPSPLSYILTGK